MFRKGQKEISHCRADMVTTGSYLMWLQSNSSTFPGPELDSQLCLLLAHPASQALFLTVQLIGVSQASTTPRCN